MLLLSVTILPRHTCTVYNSYNCALRAEKKIIGVKPACMYISKKIEALTNDRRNHLVCRQQAHCTASGTGWYFCPLIMGKAQLS